MTWIEYYQNLPSHLNPIAFQIGFFPIGWYALMYIAGFLTVYLLLRWRIKKERNAFGFSQTQLENFIFYSIFGVIIGGRLGYVFLYEPSYFLNHPWEVISPFDSAGNFIGIYGMSYHGGLLGVVISSWLFCRKEKINFWEWADFSIPAIPAGYFFGRIGNFLNGELYGRATDSDWGMYFYNFSNYFWELRWPSQLLEALFEGAILFLIFWFFRNKAFFRGKFLEFYLFGYGFFRFWIEFIREPDMQIGFVGEFLGVEITLGQAYSLLIILLAGLIFLSKNRGYQKWKNSV